MNLFGYINPLVRPLGGFLFPIILGMTIVDKRPLIVKDQWIFLENCDHSSNLKYFFEHYDEYLSVHPHPDNIFLDFRMIKEEIPEKYSALLIDFVKKCKKKSIKVLFSKNSGEFDVFFKKFNNLVRFL